MPVYIYLFFFALVALGIFFPLISRKRRAALQQENSNIAIFREAMSDLEAQLESGDVDQLAFDQQQLELKKKLLLDNQPTEVERPVSETRAHSLAGIVLGVGFVFAVILSLVAYQSVGGSTQVEVTRLTQAMYAEREAAVAEGRDPDLSIALELSRLLEKRIERSPEDFGSIYLLATCYAQLGDFEKALPLYKRYLMAFPTDESVLNEYIHIFYYSSGGKITERLQFIVDRALELNPHNTRVLVLLANHYYREGQFQMAIDFWQKMLVGLPHSNNLRDSIEQAIREASRKLNQQTRPPAS
jgi:cytochrome c-type biogenesis protein CcmH